MKILIIGFAKIKYMPYLYFYLDLLREKNEIHIAYWDRDTSEDTKVCPSVVLHTFNKVITDDCPKMKKLIYFYYFKKFVANIMNQHNFDFIIVLTSIPAILLKDVLLKQYKSRYIFDLRDLTYESIPLYRKWVGQIVENSYATFISSDAFRRYLPDSDKIQTIHNITEESINHRMEARKQGIPIKITFWGLIRHEEINKAIIRKIANDSRFEMHYYGREQNVALNLKQFVQEINAKNIYFHGEYQPADRYVFAENAALIHNMYENDVTSYAIGNKYYDGILFRIPQLCTKGSYMGKAVQESGIGITCDPRDDTFIDTILQYYKNLDFEEFGRRCDRALSEILFVQRENAEILQKLIK